MDAQFTSLTSTSVTAEPSNLPRPKLLNEVREVIRSRHYSKRTEQSYVHWNKRFIFFHGV
ncbi:MAG: phage integrase N-terminal SAM-like domain-containing protein, partial [Bacteroidota bacterium]